MRPSLILAGFLLAALPAVAQPSAGIQAWLAQLASLDHPVRAEAARQIRRVPPGEAVPALSAAARGPADEFVRYRALVLLTAFDDAGTPDLMRRLLTDRNDRVREVAYRWHERNPDVGMRPALLAALQTEQAEFVRPALVAALAAQGDGPEIRRALLPEVTRGEDFFRSVAIEALGRHRAAYAVEAIAGVAVLDGPLQHGAVLALGQIGGASARAALATVADPPADVGLTLRAAACLGGEACEAAVAAMSSAAGSAGSTPAVVRAAVSALSALSAEGRAEATDALLALARRGSALRDAVATGLAGAALRRPDRILAWLTRAAEGDRAGGIALLRDGFDDLEEDFEEEQFYGAARAAYWGAAEDSPGRLLAATLIQQLDF